MESQTPALPDPSTLSDLSPAVAITFLVVVTIVALLFYFGAPLRDRMRRHTNPAEERRTTPPAQAGAPAPSTAIDLAEQRTERFIDNLLRQVEDGAVENDRLERRAVEDVRRAEQRSAAEVARLERRATELERQNGQLREENERLRMQLIVWQRGPDR